MVECDCQERNPVLPRFVMEIMKFLSIPEPGKAMHYSSPLLPLLLLRQSSFVQKRTSAQEREKELVRISSPPPSIIGRTVGRRRRRRRKPLKGRNSQFIRHLLLPLLSLAFCFCFSPPQDDFPLGRLQCLWKEGGKRKKGPW